MIEAKGIWPQAMTWLTAQAIQLTVMCPSLGTIKLDNACGVRAKPFPHTPFPFTHS